MKSRTLLTAVFCLIILVSTIARAAPTFTDVPSNFWAFSSVENLVANGITSGCGGGNYCPNDPVTRAQMAIFLERGMRGSDYNPGSGVGNIFLDVPASYWAGGWIELLSSDGITTGCGNNNYCPENTVTREQMAVFLLRAKYGQGYAPPTPTGVFNDVVLSHWSAGWIEQLAAEGITGGCGNGNYCPKDSVTRAQMAVFLVKTFGLVHSVGDFAAGQSDYDARCASCHDAGTHDSDGGFAKDLAGKGSLLVNDLSTINGAMSMTLSNQEILDLQAFLDDSSIQP